MARLIQQLDRYRTPPAWQPGSAWPGNLAPISLGDRVCLSQGTFLCTGNHDFRSPGFDLRLGPITIGSEAWIAARAVVALGAGVSGTVPAGAIVRGNPAVVVGER